MHSIFEFLRGPALVVVIMILLISGLIVSTAFAALIAQVSLLLRLRPRWSQPVAAEQNSSSDTRPPRRSVWDPDEEEVVDGEWRTLS